MADYMGKQGDVNTSGSGNMLNFKRQGSIRQACSTRASDPMGVITFPEEETGLNDISGIMGQDISGIMKDVGDSRIEDTSFAITID